MWVEVLRSWFRASSGFKVFIGLLLQNVSELLYLVLAYAEYYAVRGHWAQMPAAVP